MRNVFIQTNFGLCYCTCLANLFNDYSIVTEAKDLEKGVDRMKGREIIESIQPGLTAYSLYDSLDPVQCYIPIFDLDAGFTDVHGGQDYYFAFLVSIRKDKKYSHCVLVIKEAFNDTLTVLDPYCVHGRNIEKGQFFNIYEVVGVETIMKSEDSGLVAWLPDQLKHLVI